jgi:hypothetical protein
VVGVATLDDGVSRLTIVFFFELVERLWKWKRQGRKGQKIVFQLCSLGL